MEQKQPTEFGKPRAVGCFFIHRGVPQHDFAADKGCILLISSS